MERCKEATGPSPSFTCFSGFESRTTFWPLSLYFIPTATLNIFIILLCVADEPPLAGGAIYWAQSRSPDGEREEGKEISVSNSVRQPLHGARLMAAKQSAALINTHLS